MGKYYVTKSKSGNVYELRQTRFKGRKTEHPHDVMVVARSKPEMARIRKKFGLGVPKQRKRTSHRLIRGY